MVKFGVFIVLLHCSVSVRGDTSFLERLLSAPIFVNKSGVEKSGSEFLSEPPLAERSAFVAQPGGSVPFQGLWQILVSNIGLYGEIEGFRPLRFLVLCPSWWQIQPQC